MVGWWVCTDGRSPAPRADRGSPRLPETHPAHPGGRTPGGERSSWGQRVLAGGHDVAATSRSWQAPVTRTGTGDHAHRRGPRGPPVTPTPRPTSLSASRLLGRRSPPRSRG
ncbi:hypothetical protein Krad_2815 [Kineococcus radiotolerans SRS30216 = ATCC BAA-149]|uniref:Uncharacterized protein n=1 Tax=Kineococcus radiotolerans (strain ATCC BAA-149 / DSM 14245 / SRS30216) TaxID=266940 RepID=A6WBU6_KINRD|nr:hypothetical protein Krad_2815 [Kineococcus radiotolerans SRS30216 = ATCC BAA-149]